MKLLVLAALVAAVFARPSTKTVGGPVTDKLISEVSYEELVPVVEEMVMTLIADIVPEDCGDIFISHGILGMMKFATVQHFEKIEKILLDPSVLLEIVHSNENTVASKQAVSKLLNKLLRNKMGLSSPEKTTEVSDEHHAHQTPVKEMIYKIIDNIAEETFNFFSTHYDFLSKDFTGPVALDDLFFDVAESPEKITDFLKAKVGEVLTVVEGILRPELEKLPTLLAPGACDATGRLSELETALRDHIAMMEEFTVADLRKLMPEATADVPEEVLTSLAEEILPYLTDARGLNSMINMLKGPNPGEHLISACVHLASRLLIGDLMESVNAEEIIKTFLQENRGPVKTITQEVINAADIDASTNKVIDLLKRLAVSVHRMGFPLEKLADAFWVAVQPKH